MKSPIEKIISSLSTGWHADERETSILFDHLDKVAYLETSEPFTARRWYDLLKDDSQVKFDHRADTLKITVPLEYCRKPELILQVKYRRKGSGKATTNNTAEFPALSLP